MKLPQFPVLRCSTGIEGTCSWHFTDVFVRSSLHSFVYKNNVSEVQVGRWVHKRYSGYKSMFNAFDQCTRYLFEPSKRFFLATSFTTSEPKTRGPNTKRRFFASPIGWCETYCSITAATVDLVDASPQTSIRSWKNSDVLNWLKEVGLQGRLVFFLDLFFIFSDLGRVWENYT